MCSVETFELSPCAIRLIAFEGERSIPGIVRQVASRGTVTSMSFMAEAQPKRMWMIAQRGPGRLKCGAGLTCALERRL